MKHYKLHIFLVTILLLGLSTVSALADPISTLPTSGDWTGGTLSQNIAVTLEGHVYVKAPVVIPSGTTLTITKTSGMPAGNYAGLYLHKDFSVPSNAIPCVFDVQKGGTLIIQGNNINTDFIAIMGSTGVELPAPLDAQGNYFSASVESVYTNYQKNGDKYIPDPNSADKFIYNFSGTKVNDGYPDAGGVIYCVGTLEMRNATIASALSLGEGAAIKRPSIAQLPATTEFGPLTLENVHIRNCYASSGPALIICNQRDGNAGETNTVESCKATITNCQFFQNYCRTTDLGGTIRTGGGVVGHLILKNTDIYNNYSNGYAGGIIASAQGDGLTLTEFDGCKIHHNVCAQCAAGAMLSGPFVFTSNVTEIHDNKAGTYGGGLFIETLPVQLQLNNNLKVYNNSAASGGGIYVKSGTLNLNGGEIQHNTAANHGGGIYAHTAILNITGGNIVDNRAALGGGIYNYGATVAMTGGNISDNLARRGGGVFSATGPATTTFENGLITGNKAIFDPAFSTNDNSGYQHNDGSGFGGGVCVVSGTFSFGNASDVGLYNNTADKAGDDLFATPMNSATTTVILPDVSSMNLKGYSKETSTLCWAEDYMDGDTYYNLGTYINQADGYSAKRYRDALFSQSLIYSVPIPDGGYTFENTYLCLALGREVIYSTLSCSGLRKGESAILRIWRSDDDKGTPDNFLDDVYKRYSEVVMTGVESGAAVTKQIVLYSGIWKVENLGWTWSYGDVAPVLLKLTGASTQQQRIFNFDFTKLQQESESKPYLPASRYGEGVVRNEFGIQQ